MKTITKTISIFSVLLSLVIAYASFRYCNDYHFSIDPQQLTFPENTPAKIKVKHVVSGYLAQGFLPKVSRGLYEINIRYELPRGYKNRRNRGGFFFIKLNKKRILLSGLKIKPQAILKLQLFIAKDGEELLEYGLFYIDSKLKIQSVDIKSSTNYQKCLWILCIILLLLAALLSKVTHPKYEMFELMWMGVAVAIILWFPPLQFIGNDISFILSWQQIFYISIAIWALLRFVLSRPKLQDLGVKVTNFSTAIRYLFAPSLFAVAALLTIGWSYNSLNLRTEFLENFFPLYNISPWLFFAVAIGGAIYVLYKNTTKEWLVFLLVVFVPISALLQQFAIQCFFHRHVRKWSAHRSLLIVVGFFVVMHAPNPFVMLGTMYLMYFWAKCYQKYPNIYALALSHHIISRIMKYSMPTAISSRAVGHNFLEEISWIWSNYFYF
ncbi:hypothetical protein [Candidatus Uabimicrobium amorphum]|uniref:CPBP family intramembrane metalloprotease n=1 Tax=Uabimicrobium amorphum TaxID=2596890 RepID=A0A5S9F1N5_UABAM|nr:hypothetical protein [Candidatus Uabimicrobium amorphum]BBM82592.1 hypothetical protein UABAM_00935 [Candidatus Uabimicrobium amorphum]